MSKSIKLLAFLLGGMVMTSCSNDVYEAPSTEDFTSKFLKAFGSLDPNQDWTMAERMSVNVTATSGKDVKIYAFNGETYKLAANYAGFTGSATLEFDGIKGFNKCVVSDGVNNVIAESGQNVMLAGTRAAGDLKITPETEYTQFTREEIWAYRSLVPENEDNSDNEGLTKNFSAVWDDSRAVTVYPVYWRTGNPIKVGVYTKNEDGTIDEIVYFYDDANNSLNDGTKHGILEFSYDDEVWTACTTPNPSNNTICYPIDEITSVRTRGYKINLPQGKEYGFVIEVQEGAKGVVQNVCYTEAKFNTVYKSEGNSCASYFQTGSGDKVRTYIGFEDWDNAGSDHDLNDFMLIVDPEPIIIDHEEQKFILACEDLGNTDDFDFNDVVFSVRHTVPETKAYVKPLAAGGTLPVWLYYDDQLVGGDEFHALFGLDASTMINTTSRNAKEAGEYEIEVPSTFTMQNLGDIAKGHLGNFKLRIRNNDKETTITAPQNGKAPQIICVPSSWKWPMERVNILEAYPDFGEWGANYKTVNWYQKYNQDKVFK